MSLYDILPPSPWPPKPRKPPTAEAKKPARMTRAKRRRMTEDAVYLAVIDEYLAANPVCAFPDCNRPAVGGFHHMARGNDRATSLTNSDLGMGGCVEHHALFDDKGRCPIPQQLAIKCLSIVRRFNEITGKRIAVEDVVRHMMKG